MELKERIEQAKTKARQMDIAGCLFSESELKELLRGIAEDCWNYHTGNINKEEIEDYFNSLNLF